MTRCQYTPEFKSKVVLNILQGNQELNEICAQHNLNPNMVRKWKQEFLHMQLLSVVALNNTNVYFLSQNKVMRKNFATMIAYMLSL